MTGWLSCEWQDMMGSKMKIYENNILISVCLSQRVVFPSKTCCFPWRIHQTYTHGAQRHFLDRAIPLHCREKVFFILGIHQFFCSCTSSGSSKAAAVGTSNIEAQSDEVMKSHIPMKSSVTTCDNIIPLGQCQQGNIVSI